MKLVPFVVRCGFFGLHLTGANSSAHFFAGKKVKRATKPKSVAKVAVTKAKSKTVRLTLKEWSEAEAIWSAGMMTRKALAEKLKITERTLQRHMVEAKIERGSKTSEHKEAVAEELKKVEVTDATILALRIRETKEDHFKMVDGLGKLTWNTVLKARADAKPIATIMNDLKAIGAALSNIAAVRAEKWALLGLDQESYIDEDEIPSLLISELTAEQVAELRNRDHSEFDEITMDEGLENGVADDDEVVEA
jgi:hypothetical protein